MRQEKFKMERQGLIHIGDEVEISEFQSYMNYSYIIEPAVAMSGCYKNSERIKSTHGIIKNIEHTPRGFIVTAEFRGIKKTENYKRKMFYKCQIWKNQKNP